MQPLGNPVLTSQPVGTVMEEHIATSVFRHFHVLKLTSQSTLHFRDSGCKHGAPPAKGCTVVQKPIHCTLRPVVDLDE